MVRSYKHKHGINKTKEDELLIILKEYRKVSIILEHKLMRQFYETGSLNSKHANKIYQNINTILSERYKDVILQQTRGILQSYISNIQNRFNVIVYNSSISEEEKKELYKINKMCKWFEKENFLARKIIKHILNRWSLPNLKNINMMLNTKVYKLEKSDTKEFKYWFKLFTGVRAQYIYIPLYENTLYEKEYTKCINNSGKLNNSIQINFIDNKLDNVVFMLETPNAKSFKDITDEDKLAIDIGLRTLLTTNCGDMYSQRFIDKLKEYDDRITKLVKELTRRNKNYKLNSNKRYKKLQRKLKEFIKNEVNRVINNLFKTHNPKEIIMENLNFQNCSLSKKMNRLLSNFGLGVINTKLQSLKDSLGIKITKVNPAYTSQECSSCGYVDHRNRNNEKFCCKNCHNKMHADINSTKNIFRRSKDTRITTFTPKQKIFQFLVDDFLIREISSKGFGTTQRCLSSASISSGKYYNIYQNSLKSLSSIK